MSFLSSGIGSLIGGVASGIGSLVSGSEASSASKEAAQAQLQMYYQTRSDLSPYNQMGQAVLSDLQSLAQSGRTGGGTDYLSKAEQQANWLGQGPTQSWLEQTPGYQWNLAQGLKATQAAAAARGLGVSGASLKGASTYATGLADSTYQNQFNNANQILSNWLNLNTAQQGNITNQFNRLYNVASLGENAAATTGAQGTQAASNYGNYLSQSGQYTAAGTLGASNALTSGINNYLSYSALNNLINPTGGTGGYQLSGTGTKADTTLFDTSS